MTTKTATHPTATEAPADPIETGPTVTRYQQLADEFMSNLNEIAAGIPKLEIPHVSTAGFVRGLQNVPLEFLATVVAAVEQTQELQVLNKLDLTTARDTLQFIEAFRPVVDKLSGFGKSLLFTMQSRKAALAADALQIYYISKGLGRDPNSAAIASLAGNMKRDLGNRGRKKISPAARKAAVAAAAATADTPEVQKEAKVS